MLLAVLLTLWDELRSGCCSSYGYAMEVLEAASASVVESRFRPEKLNLELLPGLACVELF